MPVPLPVQHTHTLSSHYDYVHESEEPAFHVQPPHPHPHPHPHPVPPQLLPNGNVIDGDASAHSCSSHHVASHIISGNCNSNCTRLSPANYTECALAFPLETPALGAPVDRSIKLEPSNGVGLVSPLAIPLPPTAAPCERVAPASVCVPDPNLYVMGPIAVAGAPLHQQLLQSADGTNTDTCNSGSASASVSSPSTLSSTCGASESTHNQRQCEGKPAATPPFEQRLHWFRIATTTGSSNDSDTRSRAPSTAAGATADASAAACCDKQEKEEEPSTSPSLRALRRERDPRSMQFASGAVMSLSLRVLPADAADGETLFASRLLHEMHCGELVSHVRQYSFFRPEFFYTRVSMHKYLFS